MNIIGKITGILILGLGLGLAAFAHSDDLAPTGTWTKKNYSIEGSWSIVKTDEGQFLELDEKFKTRNAPDLRIFLSPLAAGDVNNKNAVADSKLISLLRKNKGSQRYKIPAETDLNDYQSLIIHCAQYSKLWGVSRLN